MASGHDRVFTPRLRFVRFGRIAAEHVWSLHDRFWLQAAVRRIANSFRFGMNTGSWNVRFRHSIPRGRRHRGPFPWLPSRWHASDAVRDRHRLMSFGGVSEPPAPEKALLPALRQA